MDKKEQLQSLNALRFFFFLCVFFSHYVFNGERVLPNAGQFAVVFFLILSGFSLSYGYGNEICTLNYNSFIRKRLLRLWPMQLLTLFLRAIIILIIPLVLGQFNLKDLISFILKCFFLEAWVPDTQIIFNYNTCAWYLSPMVFCYLLFPWFYDWVIKAKKRHIIISIISYIAIYVTFIFLIPSEKHQVFLYAAPYFRVFDFILGILAYRLFKSGFLNRLIYSKYCVASITELTLLLFIAIVAWLPLEDVPPVLKMASLYWFPAFVVIVGAISLEESRKIRLMRGKLLQSAGDASYEMYMTHLFVVSICQHFAKAFIPDGNLALNLILLIICLGISIALGLVVRHWFNVPVTNHFNK